MRYLDKPVKVQKEIIKKSFIIAVFPLVFSLIKGELSVFKGFLFGLLIGTLIFRLMLIELKKALSMDKGRASNYIRNRYFIKFVIYFVVLLVARKNPSLNFLATAAGLLLIKFTIMSSMLLDLLKKGLNKKIESFQRGRGK